MEPSETRGTNDTSVSADARRTGDRLGASAGGASPETTVPKNPPVVVVYSGGPGLLDPADKEHDNSWSNYIDPVIKQAANGRLRQGASSVRWGVFRPAFEARWEDDVQRKLSSVAEVTGKGFGSYIDMIISRADQYRLDLVWMDSASDFWSLLRSCGPASIVKVEYYGHGSRGDLWMRISHDTAHTARGPVAGEIVRRTEIDARLRDRFAMPIAPHRFYACYSEAFAESWSDTYGVPAAGVHGKIDFTDVHRASGLPEPNPPDN